MDSNLTTINVTAQLDSAKAVSGLGQMAESLKGLSEQAQKIQGLWKTITLTAAKFQEFLPVLVKLVPGFTKVVEVVSKLGPLFARFLPLLARVTPVLGPVVTVLSAVSWGFSAVHAAVEKVVGGLGFFTSMFNQAKNGLVDFGETLKGKVVAGFEAVKAAAKSTAETVSKAFKQKFTATAQVTSNIPVTSGLRVRMAQLGAALQSARARAQEMDAAVRATDEGMVKVSRSSGLFASALGKMKTAATVFMATGIGALLAGFAALVRFMPKAISMYGGFEQSMLHTKSLMQESGNLTEAQYQRMGKEARRLGAITTFTASQAADGMRYLAMSGFTAKQATESLEATLNLAQAGNLGLAESARIVSSNINAFGVSARETARFTDILATVTSKSNATIPSMGESFKYVASAAGSLGVPMEQVAIALGLLGKQNLTGSMTGTGLSQMLFKLSDPLSKTNKELRKLGLTYDQVNPQTNKMSDVIKRLAKVQLDGSNAQRIFGERSARTVLSLISVAQTSNGVSALEDMETAVMNSTGATKRMSDTMTSGWFGAVKMFQSAWEEFQLTIGESGGVQLATLALRRLADWINNLSSAIKFIRDELSVQPKEWFASAIKYGAMIGVNYLLGAFKYLGGIMEGTFTVIGHGILSVINFAGGWLLQKTVDIAAPVVAGFQVAIAQLTLAKNMLWDAVNTGFIIPFKTGVVVILEWVKTTWASIMENFINPLWSGLVSIFTWVGDKFATIANFFVDKLKAAGKLFGIGTDEKEPPKEPQMSFREKVKNTLAALKTTAGAWGADLQKDWADRKKKLEEELKFKSEDLSDEGVVQKDKAVAAAQDYWDHLKNGFKPVSFFDQDAIDEAGDAAVDAWKRKAPDPKEEEGKEFLKKPKPPANHIPNLAFGGGVAQDINVLMGRTANEVIASNTNAMVEKMDEQIDGQEKVVDQVLAADLAARFPCRPGPSAAL